jgi:hypothetical protein
MENKMYKVIIECELSEKDYENRHEFTKEISGGMSLPKEFPVVKLTDSKRYFLRV